MNEMCEWCDEPLGDCSPACDRELRERLAAAEAERDALAAQLAELQEAAEFVLSDPPAKYDPFEWEEEGLKALRSALRFKEKM